MPDESFFSGFRNGVNKASLFPWQSEAAATAGQVAAYTALCGVAPSDLRVMTLIRDVQPDDPILTDLQDKFDADSAASPMPMRSFSLYLPAGFSLPGAPASQSIRTWESAAVLFYNFQTEERFGLTRMTATLFVDALEVVSVPVPRLSDCVEIDVVQAPGNGIGIHNDGTNKWFRFKVRLNPDMTGNSTDGWTDPSGRLRIDLQHSVDMLTWATGMCRDVAGATPETNPDGSISYLCESTFPADYKTKMLDIVIEQHPQYGFVGYQRDRDITSLKVNGTEIPLANYPYNIPDDITALVDDLAAGGFPGATVETTALTWKLTIPDIVSYDYIYQIFAEIDPPQEGVNAQGEQMFFTAWNSESVNLRTGSGFGDEYQKPTGQFFRCKVSVA